MVKEKRFYYPLKGKKSVHGKREEVSLPAERKKSVSFNFFRKRLSCVGKIIEVFKGA